MTTLCGLALVDDNVSFDVLERTGASVLSDEPALWNWLAARVAASQPTWPDCVCDRRGVCCPELRLVRRTDGRMIVAALHPETGALLDDPQPTAACGG